MYAIIQDGGHQYRVEKGQRLEVELRPTTEQATLTFDQVRLVGSGDGAARIGTPFLTGAAVEAVVVDPMLKGPKIHIRTYRRRKRTRRHKGHRQKYVLVEITAIRG